MLGEISRLEAEVFFTDDHDDEDDDVEEDDVDEDGYDYNEMRMRIPVSRLLSTRKLSSLAASLRGAPSTFPTRPPSSLSL